MPWDKKSFAKHNKNATGHRGEVAAQVANEVLAKTHDEGRAIREANAVVARIGQKKSKSGHWSGK